VLHSINQLVNIKWLSYKTISTGFMGYFFAFGTGRYHNHRQTFGNRIIFKYPKNKLSFIF